MFCRKAAWYSVVVLAVGLCMILTWSTACTVTTSGGGGGTAPPADGGGGGTAPPVTGPTTLLSQTFAAPPAIDFSPSAAGKVVTVRVTADTTGSRMTLQVTELGTGNVVAFYANPTTNGSESTFQSNSNGVHTLVVTETGIGANLYTVIITEY